MAHEERNDGLKRKNRIALQRYKFAIECLGEPSSVMDLGCGMGYGTHMITEAGHKVTGWDYSEDAIKYANENYKGIFNVKNLEGNIFSDQKAVCLETLCHLKDPQKFIDNIYAKELIVSAPIDPNPNDGYTFRLHNFSEEQFKGLFKNWTILKELRQDKYLVIHLKNNI